MLTSANLIRYKQSTLNRALKITLQKNGLCKWSQIHNNGNNGHIVHGDIKLPNLSDFSPMPPHQINNHNIADNSNYMTHHSQSCSNGYLSDTITADYYAMSTHDH